LSVLLGLELSGNTLTLQAVDRRGSVLAVIREQLASSFDEDWLSHPDEKVRSVRALLQHALEEGKIRPGSVAAIGVAGTSGLVLVDAEMEPVPPRAIGWTEESPPASILHERIPTTLSGYPGLTRSLVSVLDVQDWLRYRWTGALATTTAFAWQTGLTPGSHSIERWDPAKVDGVGLTSGQLPPVMPGYQRVGILQEELVRETGLPRGTWFMAGTTPVAARLWMACEPIAGQRIVLLGKSGSQSWRVVPDTEFDGTTVGALPSPHGDHWYVPEVEETADPRTGALPDPEVIYDSVDDASAADWNGDVDAIRLCADFARPSRGPALLAGVGLGWFKDMKPFWRKRCPIQTLGQWREAAGATSHEQDEAS
jgi:sugar (pentulose or hexulose) kinase